VYREVLTASADIFAKRFEQEKKAGRFSAGMRLDECQIA
jgi:hypothetical protein